MINIIIFLGKGKLENKKNTCFPNLGLFYVLGGGGSSNGRKIVCRAMINLDSPLPHTSFLNSDKRY